MKSDDRSTGSLAEFRKVFSTLKAAQPLEATYDASFAGPLWVRKAAPPVLALLGMPGWCGKRFFQGGEGINMLKGRKGVRPAFPFHWSHRASALDGRASLQIRYLPNARWPWPNVIDELRQWDEYTWLGMTYTQGPEVFRIPFPFLLQHPHALHEPHGPKRS